MYSSIAQRLTLRTTITFTILIALLPLPGVSLLISGGAQGRSEERKGHPKPGKPEGDWPNLDQVKDESYLEQEAPPPIPSTLRSKKNDGKPGMDGVWATRTTKKLSAVTPRQQRPQKPNPPPRAAAIKLVVLTLVRAWLYHHRHTISLFRISFCTA